MSKITKEIAEKEFNTFIQGHRALRKRDWKSDEFRPTYNDIVDLIMDGSLIFHSDENVLEYVLEYPLHKENGDIILNSVRFDRRIKKKDFQRILSTAKSDEDKSFSFAQYLINIPNVQMDMIDISDLVPIQQVATLFLA